MALRCALLLAALLLPALPAAAQDAAEGVAVTVYSAPAGEGSEPQGQWNPRTGAWEEAVPGFSVVKERRRIRLEAGANTIRFEDVAAGIDGSTVLFRSLTDPAGTKVVEQSFEYDLASADRILEKYLGREIELVRNEASYRGRLLSADAGSIVLDNGGETVLLGRDERIQRIALKGLPGGLVTRPTLVWLLHAGKAGDHLAEVAYETSGMSWSADYTAVVSPDETRIDLSAWVTVRNHSGASFRDAALKLVAGDLNRVPREGGVAMNMVLEARSALGGVPPGFTEKAFFEYHLYTLGRRTTLPDRALKQLELFDPVRGVPCRKVFLYDGTRGMQPWWGDGPNMDESFGLTGNRKVGVYLEIENRKEAGMGMPLPAGRMRIHKRDAADGFPELIGEDRIDHTPKDERLRLRVGDAFDIVGERRRTAFQADYENRWMRESVEIRVRNRKETAVEVLVAERLFRWLHWTLEQKSQDFLPVDAQRIHFPVKIAPGAEAVVTYTVKYSW